MTDARFPNGNPYQPPKSTSLARGILAGIATTTRAGAVIVFVLGGTVLLGEALLPKDHDLRPANMIAAFHGDVESGVTDRTRAVDVKWNVIEQKAIVQINNQADAVKAELHARADALGKRIDAVDSSLWAQQISLIMGEASCNFMTNENGLLRTCQSTKKLRADRIKERDQLIGGIKLLYTDAELLTKIGLPTDFMKQFETGG